MQITEECVRRSRILLAVWHQDGTMGSKRCCVQEVSLKCVLPSRRLKVSLFPITDYVCDCSISAFSRSVGLTIARAFSRTIASHLQLSLECVPQIYIWGSNL